MYKLSVPISFDTLTDETMPVFLESFRQCKVDRVFLSMLEPVYKPDNFICANTEKVEQAIRYFKANGLEVGVWIGGFGHGITLSHEKEASTDNKFVPMEGVYGDKFGDAYCPLDENFAKYYNELVRKVAVMHPDIIMLDDDYRLNVRPYYMGCFCPLHRKEYFRRIGEEIPREKLESLIFAGGKNKYRSEYLKLAADTLLDFAKMLRNTVDEVDTGIRLGTAVCFDNWDFCGTDPIEIAKAFAGDTRPYLRTAGAPYWNPNIIDVVENTRMEIEWCKGTGIEVFTEGDVYPRPRYHVAARVLELFELVLLADGGSDGILKYMYDYVRKPDYETGYTDRHIHNEALRNQVKEIFDKKHSVGVRAFNVMHKVENWVLPEQCEEKIANKLIDSYQSVSRDILSKNSIPTTYEDSGYPVLVCGENARYITKEELKCGAILDIPAAKILMESGIDTGLVSEENFEFTEEYFLNENAGIHNIGNQALKKIQCSEKAKVLSVFLPDKTPASYLYENEEGIRFLVLACDLYNAVDNADYTNNYYRQAQLIEAIEWIGEKKFPAVCEKNPNLYLLTSSDGEAMSVALLNIFLDEILNPVIRLNRNYLEIKFVNCSGRLEGDKVYLSEIAPYGFAAFEVR